MSGRTLTAGRAAPSTAKPNPQWDVIAMIFSILAELWMRGHAYHETKPRRDRLDRNLNRPELRDHPLWPQKKIEFDALDAILIGHERHAVALQTNLAKHLRMLSARNVAALTAQEGWPGGSDPDVLAAALWAQAKRGGAWPSGEAPFEHLAGLRALAGQWIAEEEAIAMAWLETALTQNRRIAEERRAA